MAVQIDNPYAGAFERSWFKGDLHIHTTASDGKADVSEVKQRLQVCGFDFAALADHDTYAPTRQDGDMLFLGGSEMRSSGGDILSLFAELPPMAENPPQGVVEAINSKGGLAVLAHPKIGEFSLKKPHWAYPPQALHAELHDYLGMEIYTYNVGSGFQTAIDRLDAVWNYQCQQGTWPVRIWGFATSDAHSLDAIVPNVGIMVSAPECTPEALRASLESGAFYSLGASTARFSQIELDAETQTLTAAAEGARLIQLFSASQSEPAGNRRQRAIAWGHEDKPLALEYAVTGDEGFLRIEAMDARGCSIYSNPIAIAQGEGTS